MGKKGKKKGKNAEVGGDAGPSQGAPQAQPVAQQQQPAAQQQQQPPALQRQQPPAQQQQQPPAQQWRQPPAQEQHQPPALQRQQPPAQEQQQPPAQQRQQPPAQQRQQPLAQQWRQPPAQEQQQPPALQRQQPPAQEQQQPPAQQRQQPPAQQRQQPPAQQWRPPPAQEQQQPPALQRQQPPSQRWRQPPAQEQQQPPALQRQQPPSQRWRQPPAQQRQQPPAQQWQQPPAQEQQQPPALQRQQPPSQQWQQPPALQRQQPPSQQWQQPPAQQWRQPPAQEQQQPPAQQRQQPPAQQYQPRDADIAQATEGMAGLNTGLQDFMGRGRGRGNRVPRNEQQPIPGMPQAAPAPGRGPPGAGSRGGQRYLPGMPQPAQMSQGPPGYGGGGGPPQQQQAPQRQPSVSSRSGSSESTTAGDTSSVVSGKYGDSRQGAAASPATGSLPVKTSLSAALQNAYRSQIPKRKIPNKGGSAGRPITVQTNMIPITFGKNFCTLITHYDIKLDPDKPKFMYRHVFEAVRLKHCPTRYPAFDGRCNVFSAGKLPFGDDLVTEIQVVNPQRQSEMTYKVTLARTQDIDMSWLLNVKPGLEETEREQIAIQALDVVLRTAPIRQRAITVGRSFFTPPSQDRVLDLGNGMDLWVGTFQSAVLGWKPYFNIDVAHKGFPRSQSVLDLMKQLCGDPRSNRDITADDVSRGRRQLQDFLKGLKVTYEIPGNSASRRTMGVNDLGKSSKEATFELQDGSVTTVQNYFAREKRYKIRYPDLPTLWVGSKNKLILIPAELCTIEAGQVTNRKLDERQTSTMIRHAATNTATRKAKIMEGFSKMKFNEDPAMKEFGISVGGEFETVKARVLNPPPLFDTRDISVRKGIWRANSFHKAMVLPPQSWTILNLNDRTQEPPIRNFVEQLKRGGHQVGMQIGDPLTPFKNMRAPFRDVREIIQFFNEKKNQGLKLIIVIVPDKTGPVYGKVKQVAELNVGVLTQCIKAVTIERKMNEATAGNILLKINSKLNGTNQIFAAGKNPPCLKSPCMIVGADVTHPSPDSVGIPSIAAVAASHGPRAFRYNVKIRLQPPKTEIILHLEEIMKEQLLFFYAETKFKPQRIIFFRDGVSEGQFPQVMHHELQAIRNACKKVGGAEKYEPKITFLVVQKRHHIRLFPTDPRNSDDRNGNVQAGTVVDTDITHPSHIDFYLVSHASIQGTARPTKYRCLWDDSDMSEDEIEQLTYYLCHMFSRCTRSVSYPAPTYYAHLAAFRARALTNDVEIRLNNLEEEQRTKMTIKPEILKGNPMFFV